MSAWPNTMPTTAADKAKLVSLLRESRERFLGSFSDVSDEQSRRRPGPEQWCVLETVEHLTAAETIMNGLVTTTRRPKTADYPNREEIFMKALPDRSRKMQSPEEGRPIGRFANLRDARKQFESAREATIRFVEQCDEDLRATEVTHPHPAAGIVSTYEMLIIMAKHAERHAAQIDEIKQSSAYRDQASAQT